MDDDHYIPKKNAHIDTNNFENEIRVDIKNNPNINDKELAGLIYDKVFNRTAATPAEPKDDALICRYLSPLKFIDFIETRKIAFPTASQFTDRWECVVPEDYNSSVLRIFNENKRSGVVWTDYVKQMASTWNVSCWTELNEDHDDHLLWNYYAEGSEGIGITIRYCKLKNHLINSAKDLDLEGQLRHGKVNYQSISTLPFNKHFMFRNDKEIRFAFRSKNKRIEFVSVDEVFHLFGVRISPAADRKHANMILNMWLKYGGQNRIQHPVPLRE